MNDRIVRTGTTPTAGVGRVGASRLRIITVGETEMVEALTKAANWVKPVKSGQTKVDCPSAVAETFLARSGKWDLRPLVGVIDVPTRDNIEGDRQMAILLRDLEALSFQCGLIPDGTPRWRGRKPKKRDHIAGN